MDFDELRRKIDGSVEHQDIKLPRLAVTAGSKRARWIREIMKREVAFTILILPLLLAVYWIPYWKDDLPRAVYFHSLFLATVMSAVSVANLLSFLTAIPEFSASTRDALVGFINRARRAVAVYEVLFFFASVLVVVAAIALLAGTQSSWLKNFITPERFEKWFFLRLDAFECLAFVAVFLLLCIVIYVINRCWLYLLYGRQIIRLEELLRMLDESDPRES